MAIKWRQRVQANHVACANDKFCTDSVNDLNQIERVVCVDVHTAITVRSESILYVERALTVQMTLITKTKESKTTAKMTL